MSFELRDNAGALFSNAKKEKGSKQPDYRGYLQLNGERIQLAGWNRKSKAGEPYTSLQVDTQPNNQEDGAVDA